MAEGVENDIPGQVNCLEALARLLCVVRTGNDSLSHITFEATRTFWAGQFCKSDWRLQ